MLFRVLVQMWVFFFFKGKYYFVVLGLSQPMHVTEWWHNAKARQENKAEPLGKGKIDTELFELLQLIEERCYHAKSTGKRKRNSCVPKKGNQRQQAHDEVLKIRYLNFEVFFFLGYPFVCERKISNFPTLRIKWI